MCKYLHLGTQSDLNETALQDILSVVVKDILLIGVCQLQQGLHIDDCEVT